ncbi:methylated-DNA--[protein]-cysteine S-methyltransferase [Corynebacterium yudongzhengii]|uniref:methylated-DNA--[protein]-cysteine S-methyltransferase n=1 Tax=Corynebacterium yudongzhengii TaxID=2080740 RepID=A0A2U1T7V7_9CORY|nr:methylated-DNA--[protein]-cysteine S-methyltransferase [Corynebacterium yudongzhengii]AWB82295.1 methylated-DNA--[protein]-cysteine S-methyltransferase [Corynebacterium yudongzhengii]PWC02086.1 methylated-DNA--[protein]-cysteine S-methyltransferase [Corynebacterium yudongzhengii]
MSSLAKRIIDTPIGVLTLYASPLGVRFVLLADDPTPHGLTAAGAGAAAGGYAQQAATELADYFAGRLRRFRTPVDIPGEGFMSRAQQALAEIPYGDTLSYFELAQAAGAPRAVRAAGTACARNPVPIILPCHRVVRSDGSLGNYRGGIAKKRWLLDFEAGNRREEGAVG